MSKWKDKQILDERQEAHQSDTRCGIMAHILYANIQNQSTLSNAILDL